MSISRKALEEKLINVENKEELINYIMAENGKSIEEQKARYYELEEANSQLKKDYEALVENHKDYEVIKNEKAELAQKVANFEEAQQEAKYFGVLKELNFDKDFVNKDIFNRIEKVENIDEFKANAKLFLKEHPKFADEPTDALKATFRFENERDLDISAMSDEELLKAFENQN